MKKWSEVAGSPAYQSLSPEDRDAARRQYFDSVVAPRVPEQERDAAWSAFESDTSTTGVKVEPQSRSAFGVANDLVIEAGNAVLGFGKSIGDFISPGNRVSKALGGVIEDGLSKQSDVAKAAKAKLNSGIEQADGFVEEAAAMGRYALENPGLAAAQAAGSFAVPGAFVKGGMGVARGLGLGASGVAIGGTAGGVVAGAAGAGGDAGGNAYELVMNSPDEVLMRSDAWVELAKTGLPRDQIKKELATAAARDASILPALVGGAAGAFGAEKLLAGGKGFGGNMLVRGLKAGASEAAQEGVEEGVTGYSGRAAAAELNPNIDPQKGLGADVAGGAILGFVPGAALGAARRERVLGGQDGAVDASTVLDQEPAPEKPLALPAPRVVVNSQGQAIREGSGQVFDEPAARAVGRADIQEAVQQELAALGLDPVQRATPTPIAVGPDGEAVTDEQALAARQAQRDAGTIDPPANVVGRAEVKIDPLTGLPFEDAQRATPTPITVDQDGQAKTDEQRAVRPPESNVEPQAKAVGREPVREAVREELKSLGIDPTNRATPTPIRVDQEGTARTDGDDRSVAEATQSALQREAAALYPKSKVQQNEWVQAETERQLGMDQRMRDLAEASNAKKRARGALPPTKRTLPQRDLEATNELGVVRRRASDGAVSYFFATQPENALVVKPEEGMDARKIVSIARDGQGALLRAALADGPIDAGRNTVSRQALKEIPGVATDRYGVHRLIGPNADKAKLEGELNRLATDTAYNLAEKKLGDLPPDEMEVAASAIINDPRAAAAALRSNDIPTVMERLRRIAGAEDQQEVDSTNEPADQPEEQPASAGPAIRRSGSGQPRAFGGGQPDGRSGGRDPGAASQSGQRADAAVDRPSYGTPTPNSVEVDAVHYSTAERSVLSSAMYGTGAKGAESSRVEGSDPRLKQRIYFYVDKGAGIQNEDGVGGRPHIVTLRNVYDADTDPMRLFRDNRGQSARESAVIDAGFDGYVTRNHNASGAVVLLGKHSVAVKPTEASKPNPGGRVLAPAKRENNPLDELTTSTSVPMGALTGPRWRAVLAAVMPSIVDTYNSSPVWGVDERMYRDELARELKKSGAENGQEARAEVRPQPAGNGGGREGGGRNAPGSVATPEQGAGQAGSQKEGLTPLPGAPAVQGFTGPDPRLVKVAETYATSIGIVLKRQPEYVKVDEDRATRIADAYTAMEHAPDDPAVKEAYENMIAQAVAQYEALVGAGYKFWFIDLGREDNAEYVSTPWNAMRDIRANQTMGVFPTDNGFGSGDGGEFSGNPLLAETPFEWPVGGPDGPMQRVLANDIFRAVHDAFGHGLEGAGFRAQGEENAWQAHARLFTGSALGALTSETRGQNSWLNYGPHGEFNRTAKTEDTIFADQKTGLMPEWTWQEGFSGEPSVSRRGRRQMQEPDDLFGEEVGERGSMVMNWIIQAPTDARKALGLPSFREARSITKRAFAEAVDKYRRNKVRLDDRSNKALDRLSTALADEVQWYAGYAKDSGIDWYGAKFQRAVDELAKTEPSLKERENRGLFTALLAVTSDGTEVQENLNNAMAMYQAFRQGRKLGDSTPGKGKYESSYQKNADLLDDMIGSLGLEGSVEFLLEEVYAAEAKAEIAGMGEKSNINDYPDDALVPRAAVYLGPKLGAFYANLMGNTGYLTMDRWWNRTINRYRGHMAPTPTDSSLERLREMIGSELDDEKLLDVAQQIAAERQIKYKEARERGELYPGSEIEKLATTIDNNARKELNDSPLNKSDRAMQIAVVKQAQTKLRERGIVANVADIQATIWYYEKELFEAIGVKGRGRISYEEAARNWNDRNERRPAQGNGRDAAGQGARDDAQGRGTVQGAQGSLFGELEALRSRERQLSGSQGAPQVSRRGPGLAAEMAALGVSAGRSPEALVDRLIAAAAKDAGRPVTARVLKPEQGSRAAALVRDVKDRLDVDLVLFDSNDDAMPLGASVREIPDAIFVQGKAARPEFIVGHELLHELRKAYPDLYQGLVSSLREHAQSTQANAAEIAQDYRDGGFRGEVGQDLIEEENMADVAGQAFADPAFWQSLEGSMEPSRLKQLFRWLARWLDRLTSGPKVKRDIGSASGLEAVARDMREDIAQAYAEMGRRNGAVRSVAADAGLAVKRTGREDGMRKTMKSIKDGMETSFQYGQMLARQHEWAYEVGDTLLSTQTGKAYKLTARTFQKVGPIKDNNWQPVYRYEADGGDEQGTFQERNLLESRTMKSLTRPFTKRSGGERRKDITDTDAFKRWFSGSKVVDADGRPLVVYHGTRPGNDIQEFAVPNARDGIYFTPSTSYAGSFTSELFGSTGAAGAIYPSYLSVQNPYIVRSDDIESDEAQDFLYRGLDRRELERSGYDGAMLYLEGELDQIIVFRPEQIKSAIGNDGSFDPKSPDIRRTGRVRPVANWDQPERSAAARMADSAVLGASAVAAPVTATVQAVNNMVDKVGESIARATGVAKVGAKTMDMVRKAVDAKSSWTWVERVKQGLVSDFGLPEEYLSEKVQKQARENKQLRAAKHIIDRMSSMGPDQLAVAYQWLQEKPDTRREAELLAKLSPEQRATMQQAKQDIDRLSQEAVALGLITQETYDRNAFAYVHRSYKKYEAELTDSQLLVRQRAQRLKGDQFKGRGMEMGVNLDRIRGELPDELMGLKVEMFEKRDADGRLIRREYTRAGDALPLQGYTSAGVWEVRGTDRKGQIKLWRDFTLAERQRMGEIEDARYGFARTMLQGVRDVETARFLDWVGDEYSRDTDDGLEVAEINQFKQALGSQTFTRDEWVKVPETKIKGTQVNRYGSLAGKYVPGVMWNDIMAIGDFQNTTWDKMLQAWKISKTALSPAVHVNNVMSNFIMADLADIGVNDIRQALNILVQSKRGEPGARDLIERYQDSGAEQGSFAANEMKSEVIEPLLAQIRDSEPEAVQKASLMQVISLAAHGQIGEAAVAATKTLPARAVTSAASSMIAAYQSEDAVFRLAKFIKEVNNGASDVDAGSAAREAFLDYNVNAPWIRTMRRTALPFISFTYRAAPLLVKNMATKPWKFAKYFGLGYGLSMLAYGMLGGEGDEEKEKKLLPEEMQGTSILGIPKMIRMPWNDKDGDPVWLDVRRWLPGADIADLTNQQSAVPLPPWLSAGGTLALAIDLFSNTDRFGEEIVSPTDSAGQAAEKVADHIFKWAAPNLPLPGPGSALRVVGAPVDQGSLDPYAWMALERTATGAKSITGKTEAMSTTVPNVLGVKLDSRRVSEEVISASFEFQKEQRELKTEINRIAGQGARGRISQEEMQRRLKAEIEKLTELSQKFGERMK